MSTNAKKGNEVRDYFILLRKFINHYKQHISDMIIKNVISGKYKYMYIILVDKGKNIFKTGRTKDIRKRLKTYATSNVKHPDIKFIMLVEDPLIVENCSKIFLKEYQYKKGKELYRIDIDIIKKAIFECAIISDVLNDAKEIINKQKNIAAYVLYDDNINEIEYLDENQNVIGYEKINSENNMSGGSIYYNIYENNCEDVNLFRYIFNKSMYLNISDNL
jgi:hypothetical protein